MKAILYSLKRVYHFFKTGLLQGVIGQIRAGFPAKKIKVITITGTDGKTTSSSLLYHVMKTAGLKVGLLTTVAAYIGDEAIDTGLHVTSPSPTVLHQILRRMVNQGMEYVVLEVTSHGAYQYRTWGIQPYIAGITNITRDHLDYHLDYDRYVAAKALTLEGAQHVVLNADDQSISKLKKTLHKQKLHTYSHKNRLYWQVVRAIEEKLPEQYNQMNARLVYAISKILNIENADFVKAVETFPGVHGRMQEVQAKPYRVVVDFAHTPNGLESALLSLRQQLADQKKSGRLIAVYGCAGLRDYEKRPMMGEIGARLADLAVFTAEDPRTENVWSIIRQMKEQLTEGHNKIVSIADRRDAIEYVVTKVAQPGDIVAFFGKGHEQSMCYGTIEYPWDEVAIIREYLS